MDQEVAQSIVRKADKPDSILFKGERNNSLFLPYKLAFAYISGNRRAKALFKELGERFNADDLWIENDIQAMEPVEKAYPLVLLYDLSEKCK